MDRSADLQKNLDRLYAQLAGKENALITAPVEEKERIRQQIEDLKREIAEFEAEREALGIPNPSMSGVTPQEGKNVMNVLGGQGLQVNEKQDQPIIQIQGNPTLNFGVPEKK